MSSKNKGSVTLNSRAWKKAESPIYTSHHNAGTNVVLPASEAVMAASAKQPGSRPKTGPQAGAVLVPDQPRPDTVWLRRGLMFAGLVALVGNVPVSSKLLETHSPSEKSFEIVLGDKTETAVLPEVVSISNKETEKETKKTVSPRLKKQLASNKNSVNVDASQQDEPEISLREFLGKEVTDERSVVPDNLPDDVLDEGPQELSLPGRALETYTGHVIPESRSQWITYKVKSYDNLTNIFHKIGHQNLLKTLKKNKSITKQLKSLDKGSIVRARSLNGELAELILTNQKNDKKQIASYIIKPNADGFRGEFKSNLFEIRQARIGFDIKNGLFFDARKAGISDSVIKQVVKVFDWDIDFSHDVRVGDTVTAIYEEIYHGGDKVGNRNLLAAEFINKGKTHRAIRYTFKNGKSDFFTPDGREMKKAFIRTPVSHARVSSHFNPGRFHPKLHKIRAHKGTDFAARPGTSIMATGNGKVKFIGRKGGYGRTVVIEHREGYTTLYAHMSRYKKGLRKGDTVLQGEVIGYVGSSGLATGPHLHYEFRHHDKPVNPMTVALPNSMSLSPGDLRNFRSEAVNMVLQLNVLHRFAKAKIDFNSAVGG